MSAPAASAPRVRSERPAARRHRPAPAWAATAAFGLLYVIVAPLSTDLAAAGYRSDLFSRVGFTLWDNSWYGGHHLLAYSLLAPALSALLGPQLLAAISMTAATALFAALIDGCFAPRAVRIASWWFALGAAVGLLSNRVPFELGVALGLGSLLAARVSSRRSGSARVPLAAAALALAVLCALASPIAGAFLALVALAWAIASLGRRAPSAQLAPHALATPWPALVLAAVALVPVALLALAFPEGGSEPFVASAFYPVLALVLALAVAIPPQQRLLRIGALLYALALIGAYAIPTAVGGNVDRLGALFAGPLLACALAGGAAHRSANAELGTQGAAGLSRAGRSRTWALLALAPLLVYWQLRAPIADYVSAASDPAAPSSYYAPLLAELRRLHVGYGARPARIEVVPTRNHAEARWVADRVMIARGWERQLDIARDEIFYDEPTPLEARRYGAWLAQNAVSYVALPDAPLDYSAHREARILDNGPAYLREVWRARHWRLFEMRRATPLAERPAVLSKLSSDSFTLRAPSAGTFLVHLRFTPYWAIAGGHGCVRRGRLGWTDVSMQRAGSVRVGIDFSLARVFADGPRCR